MSQFHISPKVEAFLQGTKKLFINGEWVESVQNNVFSSINPATGQVLAVVAEAREEDVDRAVKAARQAFDHGKWSAMSAADRSRLIYKLADLIEANKQELAELETLDNGKPLRETKAADLPLTIEHFRYYAGWATKIVGQTIPTAGNFLTYTRHEPVGSSARSSRGTSRC